mmetsp:Transcript_24949/g.63283  ORF Transcript_24949/g.63283 Transcript_24949/m.63283 type:complete len:319 (+) Transcript_24949:1262-2218(+)
MSRRPWRSCCSWRKTCCSSPLLATCALHSPCWVTSSSRALLPGRRQPPAARQQLHRHQSTCAGCSCYVMCLTRRGRRTRGMAVKGGHSRQQQASCHPSCQRHCCSSRSRPPTRLPLGPASKQAPASSPPSCSWSWVSVTGCWCRCCRRGSTWWTRSAPQRRRLWTTRSGGAGWSARCRTPSILSRLRPPSSCCTGASSRQGPRQERGQAARGLMTCGAAWGWWHPRLQARQVLHPVHQLPRQPTLQDRGAKARSRRQWLPWGWVMALWQLPQGLLMLRCRNFSMCSWGRALMTASLQAAQQLRQMDPRSPQPALMLHH